MSDEPQRIGPEESADTLRSVAEARVAVADSRARISATIDELEDRIVGHKEALQEKLDVARPVRAFVGASPLLAIVTRDRALLPTITFSTFWVRRVTRPCTSISGTGLSDVMTFPLYIGRAARPDRSP